MKKVFTLFLVVLCLTAFCFNTADSKTRRTSHKAKTSRTSNVKDKATQTAMKAASDMLYDVANEKLERFNWITVDEIPELFHPKQDKNLKKWYEIFENKERDVLPLLIDFKKEGSAVGLDWNDMTITDIHYRVGEFDDEFGAQEIKGYIFVKSKGKPFRIFFKRGFMLNGEWRVMMLRSVEQTSKIPDDYPKSGENK